MSKADILNKYIEDHSRNGIEQHSPEWLTAKKYVIGGSQMSVITGENPFDNPRKVIMARSGLSPETDFGQAKMCWGNAFEDVIKEYTELRLGTTILADNIFITSMGDSYESMNWSDEGDIADCPNNMLRNLLHGRVAYSPDGLGIVDDEIVLFEFKAPYSRKTSPHKVPEYYKPQVLSGLDVIGICDYSLFIEAEIRICRWSQLAVGRMHRKYPTECPASKKDGYPEAVGFMVIYGPEEIPGHFDWKHSDMSWDNDISTLNEHVLDEIFVGLSTGRFMCRRSRTSQKNDEDTIDDLLTEMESIGNTCPRELNKMGETLVVYGLIPWKLMTYRKKRVDREPNYLSKYANEIVKFTDCLKGVMTATSKNDKYKILDQVYPDENDFADAVEE
jgi:hypothetical protein